MLKTYQCKTHSRGDIHSSKTANIAGGPQKVSRANDRCSKIGLQILVFCNFVFIHIHQMFVYIGV